MKKIILFMVLMLFIPAVYGESYLINSVDWRDIYSGVVYGRLNDKFVNYLPSDRAGDYIIAPHIDSDQINIITSKNLPFIFGYSQVVKDKGISQVNEEIYENINLELFKKLDDTFTDFIVIDDSYGYNAISVAPFAVLANYYVLFIDADNLNDYINVLNDRDVNEIIIYGVVDREVFNALESYDPTIINDYGDRFRNNIEITKRFREYYYNEKEVEAKQVILTNGEFIEEELLSGTQPVLFIGRMNVPTVTREYIQNSSIRVGVLIGNELIETAQFVKDVVGISTFVKFGRSARNPTGMIEEVEDLDRYPVPKVSLGAEIVNVKYNRLTNKALVTIKNTGPIGIYLRGTYTFETEDGDINNLRRFGDNDAMFLEAGETKTFSNYTITERLNVDKLLFDGFILFGESKYSLEFRLEDKMDVDLVEYIDDTSIDIIDATFYKNNQEFQITVKNNGTQKVYFNMELIDIIILDVPYSYGAGKTFSLAPGQSMKVTVEVPMTKDDFPDNQNIKVRSFFGKSDDALINIEEKTFKLNTSGAISFSQFGPTAIIIILIILILLDLTKKKCPSCNKKNPKSSKQCKKCGHKL